MNTVCWKRHLMVALAVLSLGLGGVQAALIYEQDFTNATTGNLGVNSVGWSGFLTNSTLSALNISTTVTTSSWTGISSTAGNPSTTNGYLALVDYSATSSLASVVTGLSLDLSGGATFTWNMNSAAAAGVRLLVQINGNWYASSSLISSPSAVVGQTFSGTGTAAQVSYTFDTLASNWRSFTLVDNGVGSTGSMSLGSVLSTDLSSSVITGLGFYEAGAATVIRIDTLTITTVPEPQSWALLVLAVSVLGLRARRRRITG